MTEQGERWWRTGVVKKLEAGKALVETTLGVLYIDVSKGHEIRLLNGQPHIGKYKHACSVTEGDIVCIPKDANKGSNKAYFAFVDYQAAS